MQVVLEYLNVKDWFKWLQHFKKNTSAQELVPGFAESAEWHT